MVATVSNNGRIREDSCYQLLHSSIQELFKGTAYLT